jgi:hypothetical protein
MRYERFCIIATFLTVLSCSRETPLPPPVTATTPSKPASKPAPTPVATTSTSTTSAPVPASAKAGSYDEAVLWLRSAPAFHFVLDEGDVHAEGDLARRTVGNEIVHLRANGEEWRATAGARGVAWERRKGNGWKPASAPPYGNRIYQRVTLAFDPQKQEGNAQFVAAEGTSNHYRFTNANTGEVHDVWVNGADNHVERMKIGTAFEMKLNIEK